jgi:hypothetical protein
LAACVLIDKCSVVIEMADSDAYAVLCLHAIQKTDQSSWDNLFAVYDIDPSIACVVVCVDDPVLLSVEADRRKWTNNVDVNAV